MLHRRTHIHVSVDKVSALCVEGLGLELLAVFSRNSENGNGLALPRWLRATRDLLHDRFVETLTLDEIAKQVEIHPVHLARTFRKRFGCTVGSYQRRLRIEHAARQLAGTKDSISEIAVAAGFADQSHFSRVFKAHTGFSPARFRSHLSRS
jgi:AraC family transcriptional regulator